MGVEIERKFLVDHAMWQKLDKPPGVHYQQGYIVSDENCTVRIRVTDAHGFITLKGRTSGITRSEYEYEIPVADGLEMLKKFAKNGTEKIRYRIPLGGFTWEVDEFLSDNEGLLIAEIELKSENDKFEKPEWITRDVTDDMRYANSNLATLPYREWPENK
ncbi:CYTH domain-containing protein [Mucilaginibacter xinganensis]|uniref:CYTH domain protein n=1 Tax=Mucilaginibacter xinganensis TaxID=1234841 RepID=A0A223P2N0_9SPHI|nr:CYTH domain-containing protein [Mucilaginibacter xinganensis]ASU36300.1 CYTH domain protein [Mucilaginibacter xinganensis]